MSSNKSINLDFKEFISASQTKNFILDDPIQDWLKKYGKEYGFNPIVNNNFSDFIKKKGIEFENHIMETLRKKHLVFEIDNSLSNIDKFNITKDKMKEGIPIIYQGLVIDFEDKLFGYPDLLVRNDYLDKITNFKNEYTRKSDKSWHYVIIDIKYSNLNLKKNDNILNNTGMFACFKSQIIIYNQCLSKMQNFNPELSFILGRKWKKGNKKGNNSFDYLGKIDIYGKDNSILHKTNQAIEWIKNLNKYGNSLDFLKQIPPNMKCNYDDEWRIIKKKMATEKKEITSLWNCGVKERNLAHSKNIYDWNDKNLYAETLNIHGKRGRIINNILKTNRSDNILVSPRKIKKLENLKNLEKRRVEFICDFETVNDLNDNFKKIPYSNYDSCIFLIGIITRIINNKGDIVSSNFNYFLTEDFTRKEEKRIINEWLNFMDELSKKYKVEKPKIYHWSNAEPNFYKQAIIRNKQVFNWKELNFVDILDIFKSEPISIKGVLNYGLKDISKGLHNLKLINTIWDNDMNGRKALLEAAEAMNESKKENIKFSDLEVVKKIIEYNYVDVKVIDEIINFLRNKLI
tara:strand:+ start:3693 stop:5411 length:1719 start_codon:yes stop_codon:yes gene_type:complete